MIETKFKNFLLMAEFRGIKNSTWAKNSSDRHHRIIVINTDCEPTKRFYSDYWTSIARPKMKSDSEVLNAFQCVLNDALAYLDSRDIDDFADNFGYTKPSQAIAAYEGCQEAWNKCREVIGDEDAVRKLYNELVEFIDG